MNAKNSWKLEWKGKQFNDKLDMDIPDALEVVGHYMVKSLQKTLNQPGTGKVYKTGRSGGIHRASAPGEPPAPWSGDLRNTTFFETGRESSNFFVKVGSPMPYAPKLEFGDSRVAKRPWLKPTLVHERETIQKFLNEGVFR